MNSIQESVTIAVQSRPIISIDWSDHGVVPTAAIYAFSTVCTTGPTSGHRLRTQKTIIDRITTALNTAYVFVDRAAILDSLLHAKLDAKAFQESDRSCNLYRQLNRHDQCLP